MVDAKEFRTALSRYASGVTVVTTRGADGKPAGITVSAFSSVSLDPPLVLICIQKTAPSHQALVEAGAFIVNVLSDAQESVSRQFASKAPDRFAGIATRPGLDDLPVIEGSLANLECRTVARHDAGDHTIFVGQLERTTVADGKPLVYFLGAYGDVSSRPVSR